MEGTGNLVAVGEGTRRLDFVEDMLVVVVVVVVVVVAEDMIVVVVAEDMIVVVVAEDKPLDFEKEEIDNSAAAAADGRREHIVAA